MVASPIGPMTARAGTAAGDKGSVLPVFFASTRPCTAAEYASATEAALHTTEGGMRVYGCDAEGSK